MSRAGWGGAVLAAGLVLGLLLASGPALGAPALRRPNLRGRPVTLVPGLFPAIVVVSVSGLRSLARPEHVGLLVLLLAVGFGLTGFLSDLLESDWRMARGLEISGLLLVLQVSLALAAGAELAPGRVGTVTATALVLGFVALHLAPWPAETASAGGVVLFVGVALWAGGGQMVEEALPAMVTMAVLAPFGLRGRLLTGRAGGATVGALTGAVVAAHSTPTGRLAWLLVVLVVALVPVGLRRLRPPAGHPRTPSGRVVT